ncbi:hypothetical protein DM02DRAFT_98178 [Periconia macrospinosa]|uniref:Tyrosine specific protein phosphatases domain-containing protein n=1 Tax=Periconia macrospinosa TaxID=97972 RepID=A0A2V1E495_9PLEO|nr:hypothetical protein DM02DRAFT_98178 [Periconia macrospinosa]
MSTTVPPPPPQLPQGNSTTKPDLPSPPFFNIPNINNLRDAALHSGGLVTESGARVRTGVLFRSADVTFLDREGWLAARGLGVAHVFDLRSKPEVDKGWKGITGEAADAKDEEIRKDREEAMKAAGVERSWVPVFEQTDYSPERLAERYMHYVDESSQGFVKAYHDILVHAGPAYRTILEYLSSLPPPNSSSQPSSNSVGALIHCTAGKDRTGIFYGVLLSFLGVSDELVAEEYSLTDVGLAHLREDVVDRLLSGPGFDVYMRKLMGDDDDKSVGEEGKEFPPEIREKGRQAALRMMGAKKESMLGGLEMVRREWGSAEGYLRKVCGLEEKELEALRRALLVDGSGQQASS